MTNYQGPERRTVVTFTREDSDRLVRIEEAVKAMPDLVERVESLERKQSWLTGIGATIIFIVTTVASWFEFHRP